MSQYLVTGAAGFIARRVIEMLLEQGHQVIGIDNLNDSYDVRLKHWRLQQLEPQKGFTFLHDDICRADLFKEIAARYPKMDAVIHLAARAGVRQAVEIPEVYLQTNANWIIEHPRILQKTGHPETGDGIHLQYLWCQPTLPTTEDADSSHPCRSMPQVKKRLK
jgi:UDP-glucose 4-epimerase